MNSLDEASQAIRKESLKNPGHDFVEGIMYSLHEGVIMVGSFTSKAEPGKVFLHLFKFCDKNILFVRYTLKSNATLSSINPRLKYINFSK